MRTVGGKPWYYRPNCVGGGLICLYFLAKIVLYLHLALMGRVTEGATVRLEEGQMASASETVLYTYAVGENYYNGWRRGVDFGGERFSVIYSPLAPGFHLTSLQRALPSPLAMVGELDFWLRIGVALIGVAIGLVVVFIRRLIPRNGFRIQLLPGLSHRKDTHGGA